MSSNNRKLATLQSVIDVQPVPGADLIEQVKIMGWTIIGKKGEFKVGDLGVFFEIDSFLPEVPRYEFMRRTSYKNNELMGSGFIVRTKKIRGIFSQGLFMPLTEFPEINFTDMEVGTDLTRRLGIREYKEPDKVGKYGNGIKVYHCNICKSGEHNLQSVEYMAEALKGQPYYITEKIDGKSVLVVKENGIIRVFTDEMELRNSPTSPIWKLMHDKGIIEVLMRCDDIFIQGELYGPDIKKNRLKVEDLDFKFYNLGKPKTGEYYDFVDWYDILRNTGLENVIEAVKVLEIWDCFDYNLPELEKLTIGEYENAGQREGIVVRPQREMIVNGERLSFQVINKDYILV